MRQFIELAVNMPEQEPQVGQAFCSIAIRSSSAMLGSTALTMASIRSSRSEPPSSGAPETTRAAEHASGLHRAAGDEDRRDVQPQRGQQHAGGDLVAVGDADQRVGAVRVDHVLDGVGDDLAAGQRVEHAGVAHRDAVVHGDGVELAADPPASCDRAGDQLAHVACRCTWPGTNWVKLLAIATIGLPKSDSTMPVARHSARAPAMLRPWVVVRERRTGMRGSVRRAVAQRGSGTAGRAWHGGSRLPACRPSADAGTSQPRSAAGRDFPARTFLVALGARAPPRQAFSAQRARMGQPNLSGSVRGRPW